MRRLAFSLKIVFLATAIFSSGCTKTDGGLAPGDLASTTPAEESPVTPDPTPTPTPSPSPTPTPFSPDQISQMHTWFDGSDATTMTVSGTQISAWADKHTPAIQLVQSTASARPLLQSNALNGRSAVRFDGVNDVMQATIASSVSSDVSVSYVVQLSTFNSVIPFTFNTTTYNYGPDIYFNSNQLSWNIGDGNGNPFTGSSYPSTTAPHIFTVKNSVSLNRADLYVDGVYIGTANYRNTSITNFTAPRILIGNWVSGTYFINGYFAELVIYNKVIDETERADLEAYLKAKWGTP